MKTLLYSITTAFLFSNTLSANRLVQIRSVDFATSVLELHNFGASEQSLNGWRFCSHDEDQFRRYSTASGLNGLTLQPGESLFLHFENDAPTGDNTAIDISGRGNFALPLDRGPYGIQIYSGGGFGDGDNIADHLQWSIDGLDNTSADDRSDEAQAGGTWTDQSLWISTTANSESIVLTDTTGAELHSPANYLVTEPTPFPETFEVTAITVDSSGQVTLTWEDLSAFGPIDYTVEVTNDLSDSESWQPITTSPTQNTTTTVTNLPTGPQFFRILAQPAS